MSREEAKAVFLNRGYVEVEGGTIYDADKWRESCRVISEWLEQEPTITSTEDSAEMTYPQVEGITPTVVEPISDVDKKIESYKKLLKHPVIKHVMDMDETQEQLDFVQPHKRIPVTLTVSGDLISREAVEEIINDIRSCISVEGYWAILERLKKLPSVKPQEPCDVPDTNVGDIISKQTVLDTISELNAISFYEAQEDSRECYYEIRQAIEDLSPVKPQERTGHREYNDIYGHYLCGNCKTVVMDYDNYCPNCGCTMKGE